MTPAPKKTTGPRVISVPSRGHIQVNGGIAKELDVMFAAPPRIVPELLRVTGHFVVTMPIKSLDFVFKSAKQDDEEFRDGVRLKLAKFAMAKDRWIVELSVEVPAAGSKFDSFQTWLGSRSWLDQSSCQFERGVGKSKTVLSPDPLRTDIVGSVTATRVVVRYQFTPPSDSGDSAAWRLSCRVPGRMVEATVPFALHGVALP